MSHQAHTTAQRLLNLYRQEHVIMGGWPAVNKVFIEESDDAQVITELENMPTGKRLVAHINNLRSGKTPMDSIDKDLLPYGGMMSGQEINASLTPDEVTKLKEALAKFQPNPESLKEIKQLPFVQKFGDDWIEDIKSAVAPDLNLSEQWKRVVQTDTAYRIWDTTQKLLSETLTGRDRAQIQADMPEYETYLPMFGDAGRKALEKLRTFVSTL